LAKIYPATKEKCQKSFPRKHKAVIVTFF